MVETLTETHSLVFYFNTCLIQRMWLVNAEDFEFKGTFDDAVLNNESKVTGNVMHYCSN